MMAKHTAQNGFTIIELLVALLISGIMSSIAIAHLWTSREIGNLQETLLITEENARYAFDIIQTQIKKAGYSSSSTDYAGAQVNGMFYREECDDVDFCTDDGEDLEPDRFAVWFRPEADDLIACNGTDLTAIATPLTNDESLAHAYFIEIDINTGLNNLYCETFIVDSFGESVREFNGNKNAIIEGVENMQLQFGVFDPDISVTPTSYISADSVADDQWGRISSIRILTLISTGTEDGFGRSDARTFELLDAEAYTPEEGDHCYEHFCEIYTTTIFLENAG